MNRLTRRPADDAGSALIIALLFITSFSLLVGAVISFAEVGLRASKSLSAQADSAYATDGAVNAAVNRFRTGGPCDNYTAPLDPDGQPLGGRGVIVRCEDDNRPASGRATRPVNALLSLGSEGISTPAGFEQRVLGNIFSNSDVAAGAKLIVQGEVSATGACSGDIQTSPSVPLKCGPAGGADPSQGRDPDYTKALTAVPIRQVAPGCPAGWLVTLEPGYYDDAAALSALTNGACPGRVVWMKPGNYYLDLDFQGGNGTWVVNDPSVVVVGGGPRGWVPDPAAPLPAPTLTVPGSCQVDAADGVQLIAGGGTNLRITKGQVEVCATPRADDQSIALYGIAPDRTHTLEPSDWTGVTGFINPGNATTIGEAPEAGATAEFAAGPTGSAAMTLTGFRPGIPAGSLIDSAVLRVAHRDEGNVTKVTVAADFPGSTCTGANAVALDPPSPALTENQINLKTTCGLTSLNAAAFAALQVTYSVTTGGAVATDFLDGIAVDVAYRTPRTGKPNTFTTLGFVNETNALEIGEQPAPLTADANLTSGLMNASITLAGLGDPPIQPGSIIDSAVLRVAHQDQGDIAPPTVTVPFAGGSCTDLALPIRAAGIVEDRVDLKACGLDTAEKLLGLTATYDVNLAAGGTAATANLDGMWLELVHRSLPQTRQPATVTSSTASPTTAAFSNTDNAKVVGESPTPLTADAALTSTTPTASLTFSGYDVPAGSVIESAVLRVVHQDIGPMQTPTLAVAFPGMGGCPALTLTKREDALGTDVLPDLTPCGLTDSARLAALAVTYTANLTAGAITPPAAIARVDGVVLDVTYRPPVGRRPTSVSTTAPGFSNPDNVKIIGESSTPLTGDVTLAPGATPASVTVGGYDGGARLPAGSVMDSAVLRVAHQDDPGMGPVTLATAFDGSSCATQLVPPSPGSIGVFRSVNLKSCGLDRVDQLSGLTATYTANAPTTANTVQVPATVTTTGFANPDNAKAIGETPTPLTADAALAPAAPASITLGTYDQPAVPAGSTVGSAVLRLAHQDDAGVGPVTATVTVGTCTSQTFTFDPRPMLDEDTIDLKAQCGFTGPEQLAGLSVTYTAALDGVATAATARLDGIAVALTYTPPAVTDRLDGIELDVVYKTPTFRPLSGCLTEPYPAYPALLPDPADACALVNVSPSGDITTRFAVQGTVYAPSAALDISMAGLKDQVLTRGLVARTIRLGLKADPTYKRPLMGVPPEPVKFTAYPDVTARASATDNPTGFTTFSNPGNALAIGEKPTALIADATINADTSAALTLRGFPPDALPAGTVIDAAVLRIVNRVTAADGTPLDPTKVTATITVGGFTTGPCASPLPLPLYPALGEEQIDLKACGLTDAAQLASLSVTYTATVSSGGAATVAQLDGITLDLLSGPLLRARVSFDASRVTVEGWSVLR